MITDKLTNEQYHADTSKISSTILKMMASKTPAHVYARFYDPEREPFESTPAMQFGTAIHTCVLEPENFDEQYTVIPEGLNRRTNEGKALWAEIEASGKTALSADAMKKLLKIRASVHANPWFQSLLALNPQIESSIIFDDLKIRPDLFIAPCDTYPNGCIVDLKSTSDASPEAFGKQVHNLEYLIQVAFYCEVFQMEYQTAALPEFYLLTVESSAPYLCTPYQVTLEQTIMGQMRMHECLSQLRECIASGKWPGLPQLPVPLELPAWAYSQFEEELTVTTGE
jgi:exodeoxyribonuclease VIII